MNEHITEVNHIACTKQYFQHIHEINMKSTFSKTHLLEKIGIFRSTSKSRPNNITGEKCPYVRPSTISFFDFNEIWYIGRGRWVMHDVPYDRIQGQGHEPFKVWIPSIFRSTSKSRPNNIRGGKCPSRSRALESLNSFHFQNLSPPTFTMGAGKWPLILKLDHNI